MASYLDGIIDISEMGQHKLVVLYGRSNSGKTMVGSTFPKPMLYVAVGDDGSNTIQGVEGIKAKKILNLDECKGLLNELVKKDGAGFKSIFIDTFSMVTNIWIDENAVKKNKRMTQQMWGDLKTETEELIRMAHKLADKCWVILSCHEATDVLEGMEDEIMPDVRPSTTKGARTYLEGMANFGLHTTRLQKEVIKDGVEQTVVKYAAHIGANPYYWTKLQISPDIKVPKILMNPTYNKLMKIINGGN